MEVKEYHINEYGEQQLIVESSNGFYIVQPNHIELRSRCDCPDWYYRYKKKLRCKHQEEADDFLNGRGKYGLAKIIEIGVDQNTISYKIQT